MNDGNSTTFEELKRRKITVEQLISWSVPIDLLESYQFYLDQATPAIGLDRFYNCSEMWFGPFCQYTFDSFNSFADIVRETFRMKEGNVNDVINVTEGGTCYQFLSCYRGPGDSSCLDWREVCDGKIDCIDGIGIDEKGCFEMLELNECDAGEFRCRNGLCIPEEFLWERSLDLDCLDGSDENYPDKFIENCYQDPSFRCEERTCQISLDLFACGDGECIVTPIPSDSDSDNKCANGREIVLSRAILAWNETSDLPELCWAVMICALQIYNRFNPLFDSVRCEKICGQIGMSSCDSLIEQHCPSLFVFPEHPIVYGHIMFVHTNERPQNTESVRKPMYLCYNKHLCPKLFRVQNSSNDITCTDLYHLNVPGVKYGKYRNFIRGIVEIFRQCPSIDVIENTSLCLNKGLFVCRDVPNCFSKHRLVDGIDDCNVPNDELGSCSVNHTHRFHCTSESNRCISPFSVHNQYDDCIGGEDEMAEADVRQHTKNYVPFQILCDGFEEYSMNDDKKFIEADETHCDLWPCDNQYTRCNLYYNCPNGADEAGCPWTSCPPKHLPCIDPISKNMTCLPLALVNDNISHCLGSSDERYMCRTSETWSLPNARYKCWNESDEYGCISVDFLCDNYKDCEFGDDEQFCDTDDKNYSSAPCNGLSSGNRIMPHDILCKLSDADKPRIVYFSLKDAIPYPSTVPHLLQSIPQVENDSTINFYNDYHVNVISIDFYRAWYCNRGIFVRHRHLKQICLCPPSYYGDRCEFQSQRVSVTIQMKAPEYRTMISLILSLVDDNEQIHSYEQLTYIPFRDCRDKFNRVLLYKLRPKDPLRTYSVRIQAFQKSTFIHRGTWLFPIKFPVLPVYRLVQQVIIPLDETNTTTEKCPLKCQHGLCQRYLNREIFFCRCDPNWSGALCNISYTCQCSSDSLCVGISNKRSICICPPHKYGPRCLLTRSLCSTSYCHHRGQCVFSDERITHENFLCLCHDGFSGLRCEHIQTQIDVSFAANVPVPQVILGHFITVFNDSKPTQVSTYKKVAFDRDIVTFFFTDSFHMLFTEFGKNFYVTVVQENFISSSHISVRLMTSNQCSPIENLLNASILKLPRLRSIKHYHVPCQKNSDLACFYDEVLMCLCNHDRFANCFSFDRNVIYSCPDYNYCENKGQCFQNSETCQTPLLCVCNECFYGKRCQLSTNGFGLSLDAILGYQIHPNVPLSRQSTSLQASIIITTIMAIIGFVSSFLSIITFRRKGCQEMGCGHYLLRSSICSFATMIFFLIKFWFLVWSQMTAMRKTTFLLINCVSIDVLLRILLSIGDWLNAVVAVERTVNVWKGVHFDKKKSRRNVRWIFLAFVIFFILTTFHDPIHRHVIFDDDEERSWCLVRYSPILQYYNSIINIIHFFTPFSINIISALLIMFRSARIRFNVRAKLSYGYHLREQFYQHKHLLISPIILIILALPRLIISFISGCMKSARDTWPFLVGYFVAFIPSTLIFFIFVSPSATYKREFKLAIKHLRRCFWRCR